MAESSSVGTEQPTFDEWWKREVIGALKKANAVQYGEFELSHGGTSDYYIDKYLFETDPNSLEKVAEAFSVKIDNEKLAGVALGAVPLVSATSIETDSSYVIVRKEQKGYGTANRIEGRLNDNKEVVVIEDVTTTGTSAAEAVEALREAGAIVNRVLVVVDREEGARDKLAGHGVDLEPLLTASELLEAKEMK